MKDPKRKPRKSVDTAKETPSQPAPTNNSAHRRLHVFYSGTVQGVGFRYSVLTLAQRFKLNGWVRNCPDERVEVMVEGDVQELERYLQSIGDEMCRYIKKVERSWENATHEWNSFKILP